jgi:hypothetical protein
MTMMKWKYGMMFVLFTPFCLASSCYDEKATVGNTAENRDAAQSEQSDLPDGWIQQEVVYQIPAELWRGELLRNASVVGEMVEISYLREYPPERFPLQTIDDFRQIASNTDLFPSFEQVAPAWSGQCEYARYRGSEWQGGCLLDYWVCVVPVLPSPGNVFPPINIIGPETPGIACCLFLVGACNGFIPPDSVWGNSQDP